MAASLQQSLGDIDGVPADICQRALRAIERAAMAAKGRGLHSGSLLLLDRALELLDPADRANRQRTLLARASSYAHLRMAEAGLADVEAVSVEVQPDDRNALAHLETIRGELLCISGDTGGSVTSLEHAIELWREEGDVAHEALALRLIGMTHMFGGNNEKADHYFTQALAIFRDLERPSG